MLKLKLQYFVHLMQTANSLEKILMLGKMEGKRRRWQQRVRGLEDIIDSVDMSLSVRQETVKGRGAWCAADHGAAESQTRWAAGHNSTATWQRKSGDSPMTASGRASAGARHQPTELVPSHTRRAVPPTRMSRMGTSQRQRAGSQLPKARLPLGMIQMF